MRTVVYLNGKFVASDTARISALAPGFLFGCGVFETIYVHRGRAVALKQHLQRLIESLRFMSLALPMSRARIEEVITETVRKNGLRDAAVRMTVWEGKRSAELLVTASVYEPLPARLSRRGMKLWLSPYVNQEDDGFPRLKTTGYLPYLWSYRQARKRGFDEALIVTARGNLSEASRSNVFFVADKKLYTPGLNCGCLNGITRWIVLRLARRGRFRPEEGTYSLGELYRAQEVFLTGSLKGIVPVCSVGDKSIGTKVPGPITGSLMKAYRQELEERRFS